ncbi:hypothetical protein BDN70DRAFT_546360 [Pholiota conissans]|uniref:Uncharacterized protein n=1 Tax=Pholiota conissans TaxID=109636 RepID=A0A9P6CS41_9AGAR|nr:hypothetical protein BDN70DRAFT_546360 [Pholiota conissans]
MIHPISSNCQNQKAHGTVETHELGDSTDTTNEVKLGPRSEDIGKKGMGNSLKYLLWLNSNKSS